MTSALLLSVLQGYFDVDSLWFFFNFIEPQHHLNAFS